MLSKCEQIYASDLKLKNDKDLRNFYRRRVDTLTEPYYSVS